MRTARWGRRLIKKHYEEPNSDMHARSQVGEGLRITLVDPRHGRGCDRVKELLILGSFPLGLGEYDSVTRIFTCKATPQNRIPPPPYPPVQDRTDSDTNRDRRTHTHTRTPTGGLRLVCQLGRSPSCAGELLWNGLLRNQHCTPRCYGHI